MKKWKTMTPESTIKRLQFFHFLNFGKHNHCIYSLHLFKKTNDNKYNPINANKKKATKNTHTYTKIHFTNKKDRSNVTQQS